MNLCEIITPVLSTFFLDSDKNVTDIGQKWLDKLTEISHLFELHVLPNVVSKSSKGLADVDSSGKITPSAKRFITDYKNDERLPKLKEVYNKINYIAIEII